MNTFQKIFLYVISVALMLLGGLILFNASGASAAAIGNDVFTVQDFGQHIFAPQGLGQYFPQAGAVTAERLLGFLISIRNFLLYAGVIIAVIFLAIAGLQFITARGDETQIEKAKNSIRWAFFGLLFFFGIYVVFGLATALLRLTIF